MGEYNPFRISEFEWEVLNVYIKHGYGCFKMYDTLFFRNGLTDETVLMTLEEYADRAIDYDDTLWKHKELNK